MDERYDLNHCPNCGGPADNGNDRCVPPSAYYCTKCLDAEENKANLVVDTMYPRHANIRPVMEEIIRFRVDSKLKREFEKLARQDGREVSNLLRHLMKQAVDKSRVNDSRPKATVA